ncbi:TetR/AcrR family transcriptional regulator [Promicromonospora sp. NPDC050262]|uniref:TetR/AcrR family transcriptional regulator n=1 Tax=Promicromonospora sp. NPDC050262 TaxID=3155036 RepID=UPI0033F05763
MPTSTAQPRSQRRVRPAQERRRDLLDAALTVFVRRGVAESTVEELTRTAGMSKGSFYLHFSTKEDLAAAAWARHMESFAEVGERILGDEGVPIGDRLVTVLQELTRFALEHGDVHRALYGIAGADAVKDDVNERLIAMIAAAASTGVETGAIRATEPALLARALYHGYCGAATDAVGGSAQIDHEDLIRSAGAMTRAVFPAATA